MPFYLRLAAAWWDLHPVLRALGLELDYQRDLEDLAFYKSVGWSPPSETRERADTWRAVGDAIEARS